MKQDEDYDIQNSEVCRCGHRWGEHEATHSLENMKERCVACDYPIMGQCEILYKQNGNYCRVCSGKADKAAKARGRSSVNLIDIIFKK